MPRKINYIVIHCSDTQFGDARLIDMWHKERGWQGIGYHYVILNCYPTMDSFRKKQPEVASDGVVQKGRPEEQAGAHARQYNANSIGICLIGQQLFTTAQFASLKGLVTRLLDRYPGAKIVGHYEIAADSRTCPNLDMEWLRKWLSEPALPAAA